MSGRRMDKKGAGVHQTEIGELPNFRHDPRILCGLDTADLFFHPDGEKGHDKRARIWAAQRMCSRCPLAAACDDYAQRTRQPHGTFGGVTADERGDPRDVAPAAVRDPAVYDRLEPCPSPSAIRRHRIRLEHCPVCGVDGPVRKKAA